MDRRNRSNGEVNDEDTSDKIEDRSRECCCRGNPESAEPSVYIKSQRTVILRNSERLSITGLIIWRGTIGQPHLPEMELPFPPSFESPKSSATLRRGHCYVVTTL